MQYAAALIEYIVTGLISLVWLYISLDSYFGFTALDYIKYKEVIVIIAIPISYVLGIYVDVSSSFLIMMFNRLLSKFNFGFRRSDSERYKRSAEVLSYSPPDIIRTMETYVSRDRIARGVALNSFVSGLVVMFLTEYNDKLFISLFCFFITVYSIMAWFCFRRLSKAFKAQALKQLKERQGFN